ncbi:MAG: hypothetical protein ACLUR9_06035 [Christensenellales bacterium]
MITIDPQQELFIALKLALEALGYDVYDGFLPPEGTDYPFVYMGDFQQIDDANKTAVFGNVIATIHVWSNTPKNRGTLSNMLLNIKTACRKIDHTSNFAWSVLDINQRILPENTTKTPLLHGVIEAEFKFS